MKGGVLVLQVMFTVQRLINAFARGKVPVPWKDLPSLDLSTLIAPPDQDVALCQTIANSLLDPILLGVFT